jgi:hypothetical protein
MTGTSKGRNTLLKRTDRRRKKAALSGSWKTTSALSTVSLKLGPSGFAYLRKLEEFVFDIAFGELFLYK